MMASVNETDGSQILDRYPGIRPFKREERFLFFGRNKEIGDLLNAIKVHDVFVLFSKSGLGKSSLLNAGLIPRLQEEKILPIVIRFLNSKEDPLLRIAARIKAEMPPELLEAIPNSLQNNIWVLIRQWPQGTLPLLVFDQFEEFFYTDPVQRQKTIIEIAHVLNNKMPESILDDNSDWLSQQDHRKSDNRRPAKLLFLIRSDRLSFLEELSLKIPSILNNRYELKPLLIEKAEQAIVLPAQFSRYGNFEFKSNTFEYSIDALKILITALSNQRGEVESSQLQLVCQEMERIADRKSKKTKEDVTIEPIDYGGVQGIKDILNKFYENQILKLRLNKTLSLGDDDISVIRRLIENQLLSGHKRINQAEEKVKEFIALVKPDTLQINGVPKSEAVINELLSLRLIREEETHLGKVYEISHDTLIESIARARDTRLRERETTKKEKQRIRKIKTPQTDGKKRCFVVMGFGVKTDYATGRKLDLNKTYRVLIKPAVEDRGLVCLRMDEIPHSGSIDLPAYKQLLQADIVIADLSTANVNAFYELGVRHALRPFHTIVISEDKLTYPFDVNHISVLRYTHLGDGIEYEEVERFRKVLADAIDVALSEARIDSPIYTYLPELNPPELTGELSETVDLIEAVEPDISKKTFSILMEQGDAAMKQSDFLKAKALYDSALMLTKSDTYQAAGIGLNQVHIIHSLARAVYKSRVPTSLKALEEALLLLQQLDLENTNDSETLELASTIERRMYVEGLGAEHLNAAVGYCERAFYLFKNRYNGIQLSFLLTCRANSSLCPTTEDKITDLSLGNRIRAQVIKICDKEWNEVIRSADRNPSATLNSESEQDTKATNIQKFWILANKAEAFYGLGKFQEYKTAIADAESIAQEKWLLESCYQRINQLREQLTKAGHLLNPAWKEDPV